MTETTRWTLKNGVAVLTGAASGIGAALAQALAVRGMHLALVDRQPDALEAVARGARASGVTVSVHVLDVTDRAGVAALPQAVLGVHSRVTVLVNNAGVAVGGTFDQVAEADFDWLMDVNFGGAVRMTRAFMPVLAREPAAQIVNVSSILGIVATPGQTAYCASKFAVRGFSESLRHELEMQGGRIGVTVVHPGGVRTAIAANARAPAGVTQAQVAEQVNRWGRLLRLSPQEAAEVIARGIERRVKRVLVGKDAKQAAFLQRLFPVGYWKSMARGIERELRKP